VDGVNALGALEELDDIDLLARVIGQRSRDSKALEVATRLLRETGGLEGMARLGPAAWAELSRVSSARAERIGASLELGRRLLVRAAEPRPCLATPTAVAELFRPRLGLLDHEQMWVLSLDARSRLRGMRRVAQGGAHGCAVSAREILRAALADAAMGFVLVHNHPSGDPSPSSEDVAMTRAVGRAAEIVGVALLDHVIVTASEAHASLLERGLL